MRAVTDGEQVRGGTHDGVWLQLANYRAHVVRHHVVARGGERDLGYRINRDAVRRHGTPARRGQAASQA